MDEKKCPICSKKIRSNAEEKYFCMLCGMGIPISHEKDIVKNETDKGVLYFCCERCASIYQKEVKV
jgi:endogenous inhibitor of DNA gyrase (YacG/DUF329 family)